MNEKVKNWFGKHKWHIVCGIVSAGLIVGCALNIYYACKSGSDANIFTAIGGWIGFLATAGVGAITLYQNRRSEIKLTRQSKIKDLESFKQFIYATYNGFISNRAVTLAIEQLMNIVNVESCKNLKVDDKRVEEIEQQNEILRRKIDFALLNYGDFCECQANDINNTRYNFERLAKIHKGYTDLILTINMVVGSDYTEVEYKKLKDVQKKVYKIRDLYTELLIDIENSIQELNNIKLSDKEFEEKCAQLKDIKRIREIIKQNVERYNKETQNGQAEDDVDGQGE